jgi:hypothetical protein
MKNTLDQVPPKDLGQDLIVIGDEEAAKIKTRAVRLLFDGYKLHWQQTGQNKTYTGFSGLADESAKESEKDKGPVPQGLYAVDPAHIQIIQNQPGGGENPDWGRKRVALEPYRATVDRMLNCFRVIRTGMYIHGGNALGTIGCIELNNDAEHADFFSRLGALTAKIELEVKYTGDRETKFEDPRCPV